jgi:hypothetical protein
LSANARVFQTLAIAIIAMFIISRSEIITFAEKIFLNKIVKSGSKKNKVFF